MILIKMGTAYNSASSAVLLDQQSWSAVLGLRQMALGTDFCIRRNRATASLSCHFRYAQTLCESGAVKIFRSAVLAAHSNKKYIPLIKIW